GYAMAGYTSSFGDSLQAILVRTDSSGNSGCNERAAHPQIANAAFADVFPTFTIGAGFNCAQLNYANAIGNLAQTILCENPLFIAQEKQPELHCFPIPASEKITVNLNNGNMLSLELFDITGRLIIQQQNTAQSTTDIDLKGLPEGIYLLRVLLENGTTLVRKIEIQ
ncbi:MAG: T9SS type A sorting domain-containing protein, partial [Bacteroidia bacterium]